MKMKQRSKKAVAWWLTAAMCLSLIFISGQSAVIKAEETDSDEMVVTLNNPVIAAEDGNVVWDCIYFGNYWQSEYITQPGNQPNEGEDDVVHTDTDGTKYIVRKDAKCYKYEPIKWRVLSVNEDGTDAFLMADQCLDSRPYHTEQSDTVTWETCSLREWLNGTFLQTAFSETEQGAIVKTEIDNSRSPYYKEGTEVAEDNGISTQDTIYLLSVEEAVTREYGFVREPV